MKTKQYIIATLIALIFGVTTIQAQPARRTAGQNERPSATRTQTKSKKTVKAQPNKPVRQVQKQQPQRQKASQPSRTVQKQQPQRQKASQPSRTVQKQQPQRRVSTQTGRTANTQQVDRQRNRKPVSISTPNNPKSDYRRADTRVYTDHKRSAVRNKYSTKHYYGGHHYHYAYPTRKVKFHYHHDTYVHNYHVLYYPAHRNIYWTRSMYRDYHRWYPNYRWNYRYGHTIQIISVFDAQYNLGEVAMVYGRVYATWHNKETDDYLLFFGGDYPYQRFTVVLPGNVARRFSWRPERYFLGEHLTITGLITTFEGNPEIIVKHKRQVGIY